MNRLADVGPILLGLWICAFSIIAVIGGLSGILRGHMYLPLRAGVPRSASPA